jgi:hypothetical protein
VSQRQLFVHYRWDGFRSPVVNDELNWVKAGGAVPMKFSLSGNYGLTILPAATRGPRQRASAPLFTMSSSLGFTSRSPCGERGDRGRARCRIVWCTSPPEPLRSRPPQRPSARLSVGG